MTSTIEDHVASWADSVHLTSEQRELAAETMTRVVDLAEWLVRTADARLALGRSIDAAVADYVGALGLTPELGEALTVACHNHVHDGDSFGAQHQLARLLDF